MAIAVLRFPGTNNEKDLLRALALIPGANPFLVPARKGAGSLKNASGVVIPGGFSYGDYLRAGSVAAVGEIIDEVKSLASSGLPVLGICNGFQILTEAGLLPGALLPNTSSRFICKWQYIKVIEEQIPFTEGLEGAVLRLPIAHAEGNYYGEDKTLQDLNRDGRVVFFYCDKDGEVVDEANPNGSAQNIAGIVNKEKNVMGMMPHPERASRPVLSSVDGLGILENFVNVAVSRR